MRDHGPRWFTCSTTIHSVPAVHQCCSGGSPRCLSPQGDSPEEWTKRSGRTFSGLEPWMCLCVGDSPCQLRDDLGQRSSRNSRRGAAGGVGKAGRADLCGSRDRGGPLRVSPLWLCNESAHTQQLAMTTVSSRHSLRGSGPRGGEAGGSDAGPPFCGGCH